MDQAAGRTANAEKNYRAALATEPNLGAALFNLAIIRTAAAPAEGIELYRHLIAAEPNNAPAHLNLGFLLKQVGRTTAGDTELRLAVTLDPALASRIPATAPAGTRATGTTGATGATGATR